MDIKNNETHKSIIEERKHLNISAVKDVISFDTEKIILDTIGGILTIRGQKLHVKRLSVEKGEVDIEGIVDGFGYKEQGKPEKNNQSVMKKLFG